ncbi:MAG: response regulator, partial [Verrucomicrobiae bacterium]|nr:response regulator [Verrucomicrobiae bacterium]
MNSNDEQVGRAFREHEREGGFRRARVACILVIVLMPAGAILDAVVYSEHFGSFLILRLASSAVAALVYFGLGTKRLLAFRSYLAAGWYLVPIVAISAMIAMTEGALSPYYAGLNLVALCAAVVLQVTLRQSIGVIVAIFVCFGSAGAWAVYTNGGSQDQRLLVNNVYFLVLTAVVVVTGSVIVSRMRFREFGLRYALDEKTRELEASNEKLRALDEAKSRFFANISHELRTPLTLLLSPLDAELERPEGAHDEMTRSALNLMRDNGLRLLRLINDLLDLVKLDSVQMKLSPRPVDLPNFLSGLISSVAGVAREKRIAIVTDYDDSLKTFSIDQEKIEKVILNLLFNSLKFTMPGGRITVRGYLKDELLGIEVEDTGIGISEEDLPKLFHRFWQADDSSRRKFQGTGIGLSLAKELVTLHGGTIVAKSTPGVGTRMSIHIPFTAAAPVDSDDCEVDTKQQGFNQKAVRFGRVDTLEDSLPPNGNRSQVGNGKPRVLIADDERDMLEFLASQLEEHYEIVKAADGAEALELGKNQFPDAIILDGMMPELDGFEVCRQLRMNTSTRGTPIIMLTARADEETKMTALRAGATDFLTKPFSLPEVRSRLKNLVEGAQYQKELSLKNALLENAIQDLKETRQQLAQSEKLASLGQMSAGIIHEINNPLNFVKTSLYTLSKLSGSIAPEDAGRFKSVRETIENGVERIERIVSELRLFAHESPESIHDISVLDAVLTAQRFCSHELSHAEVELDIPEERTVLGNSHKLMQVFLNLIQNAAHATAEVENPKIRISSRMADDRCVVTVSDNGTGI